MIISFIPDKVLKLIGKIDLLRANFRQNPIDFFAKNCIFIR